MSALTNADLQRYVAEPEAPTLTEPKKERVAWALESTNARGKRGAFGSKIQAAMVEKLVGGTGRGAAPNGSLVREVSPKMALTFRLRIYFINWPELYDEISYC